MSYTEQVAKYIVDNDLSARQEPAYVMEMWKKADQTQYKGIEYFVEQIVIHKCNLLGIEL